MVDFCDPPVTRISVVNVCCMQWQTMLSRNSIRIHFTDLANKQPDMFSLLQNWNKYDRMQKLKWKIRGEGIVHQLWAPNRWLWARERFYERFIKSEVWECWNSIMGGAGTAFPCLQWHFSHWSNGHAYWKKGRKMNCWDWKQSPWWLTNVVEIRGSFDK